MVCNLHDCSRHDRETQEAHQACKIVSTCICRNSEAVEKVLQPEITQKDNILEDLSQLYVEQVEHDAEQVQRGKEGEEICCSSKCQRAISLMEKGVCRQEHYCKWLTMQNVLNSMRDSDIRATGYSNIPSHDK